MRLAKLEQRAEREQRLVALGSMSSVMAHELRNPLASLKGHAQLLLEDSLEPGQQKKVARVVAEAERLEALTTNLLDFVRDGPIERSRIETAALVDQVLRDLPRDRVKVHLDAAPESLVVDPSRIARAVHNLVDNALEVSGTEPVELSIARSRQDGAVVIEVRDRGPGIPAGSEQQIFEPFMTTRVRGTGLGLPIARRIAEQHDGTLTGEGAKSGGGAIFRLTLPMLSEATT
jgi:two-component system sensor histidine kinase HydH